MPTFDVPEPDYDRYTNRQLVVIPLTTLAIALLVIGGFWVLTGSPATYGVDFTGGAELTVDTTTDREDFDAVFDAEIDTVQTVPDTENRFIITFRGGDIQELNDQAEAGLEPVADDATIIQSSGTVDPVFAAETLQLSLIALAIAFLGMSLLAFVLFRTFVPSIAIVASAFSDMAIPLAAMNVLGIDLTVGTIAALLMLIGYSVDSDILLNTHILRRRGDFYESTYRAMQTGVTMTVTSMAAMATMGIMATLFGIDLLAAIGIILFIGLAADLMNTYLLNLSLLRWYKFHGVNR